MSRRSTLLPFLLLSTTLPFAAACLDEEPGDDLAGDDDVELDDGGKADIPRTLYSGALIGANRRCLVAQSAQTNDGTRLVAADCVNTSNEKWSYDWQTQRITGPGSKCLTARSGMAVLWTCGSLASQRWSYENGRLRNNGGQCLVSAASNGMQGALASCTSAAPQQWAWEPERRLRLQIVMVRDSGGGRAPTVTAAQIQQNLASANIVYAPAHVSFWFDSNTDVSSLWDTGVNNIACARTDDVDAAGRGAQHAARFEGKIVVFVRQGSGGGSCSSGPTGGGGNAVYFRNTWAGDQLLAHELGHYLGLDHTFVLDAAGNPFDTLNKVRTRLAANGNNISSLDGDALSDTPPDVGPQLWANLGWARCDPSKTTVQVTNAIALTPDRLNVMSYWDCPSQRLTTQQIARVRQTIDLPMRRVLINPVASSTTARPIFGFGGLCLAVANAIPRAGDAVIMTPCTDVASNTWRLPANGEIRTWNDLCVKEGPAFALRQPTLAACNGAWDLKWGRTNDGDLVSPSGLCLASDSSNAYVRARAVLFGCANDSLNKWWSYLPRPAGGPN